jgi:Na+/H+ antiporter NhaD/arsenite permease-like protein
VRTHSAIIVSTEPQKLTCFFFADAGIYGAIYFAANLMSAVLTNNAAALLMYPIAMAAVDQTGTDRLKMSFILMLAASDYMTSFGYQTNLMVYGPGGYSNMDFMKFGGPMQLILWLSSVALVSATNENWYVSWFICALGLMLISFFRLSGGVTWLRKTL